ncbi:MAG: hypothetical protein AAF557_24825 [Pseudomonadota bacterium]
MSISDSLEAMMLCCFSIGWYWSIFAMLWTRQPYGKSAAFVSCTIVGYALGLGAKLLLWHAGQPFSYLIVLYSWNLVVTGVDLWLFLYFAGAAPAQARKGRATNGI